MKILKDYEVDVDGLKINIKIISGMDFVTVYSLSFPEISQATLALLDSVKEQLLRESKLGIEDVFDPVAIQKIKIDFSEKARKLVDMKVPTGNAVKNLLVAHLMEEMLGLGKLEILIADGDLEEIVVNTSKEPVWVYHKEFGWLKTNIIVESEKQVQNYASIIARRVRRQITTLEPLLDAHLITGDRANATLFPISTKGNTLTIRKFARKPWTITDFITSKTIIPEAAAFLWMAIQYELNIIVAGGTSSGKTALLNTLMPFIQPYHRIISIEDTRELALPSFLHWVPMTTREANPEGKGRVSMLDLMINSLRMRPDRIVVGEIRKGDQAEVLFEAMHTGHSVYATLHADTADQVIRRMTNPPINIPEVMLESLHLIAVQYRDRRKGIRRVYQIAELLPVGESGEKMTTRLNLLYRTKGSGDIVAHDQCVRVFDAINLHTGMSINEIINQIKDKMKVLEWMAEYKINDVDSVGRVIAEYYSNEEKLLSSIKQNKKPEQVLKEFEFK